VTLLILSLECCKEDLIGCNDGGTEGNFLSCRNFAALLWYGAADEKVKIFKSIPLGPLLCQKTVKVT
jgi:hypothetical protein